MKTRLVSFAAALLVVGSGQAGRLTLEDCAVNLDGVTTFLTAGQVLPPEVDATGFDLGTGLGTISVRIVEPVSKPVNCFWPVGSRGRATARLLKMNAAARLDLRTEPVPGGHWP